MKRQHIYLGILLVTMMIALLGVFSPVDAQTVRVVDKAIWPARVDSAMSVTSTLYTLEYGGNVTSISGQYPDSIHLAWYVSGDSICKGYIAFESKLTPAPLAAVNSTVIDSFTVSDTGKTVISSILVPYALWKGMDQYDIVVYAADSGNAVIPLHANKIYLQSERYFRRP